MNEQNTPDDAQGDAAWIGAKGAVVYTDGSCKNGNPGHIGWGAHGYIYKFNPSKSFDVDNHSHTARGYYTTRSLAKNVVNKEASPLSQLVEVEPLEYVDFMGSSLKIATNNSAELQATSHTIERLLQHCPDLKFINIITDSEYVVKGLNQYCRTWERYNWKTQDGGPVKNSEWWIPLYEKVKQMRESGIEFNVEWIRGHDDNMGNVQADILAGIAAVYSAYSVLKVQYDFHEQRGYWKSEIERHPFLNFKRIYFNSVVSHNIAGNYFQADSGAADNLLGKRIPETGLAIVKLREPDPVIEAVKTRQFELANEINAIIMMKLDRVFSKEVYPYLSEHGKFALMPGRGKNMNLDFHDREPVTIEVSPTGLSMRAIEAFNLLEELLGRFMDYMGSGFDRPDNNIQLKAHDITSVFYDREEKVVKKDVVVKSVLKPEFVVGFRDMSIDIEESYEGSACTLKIPLILGTDLLPRNNLKKLEELNPRVYLITWRESKNSVRYATVIECDSGIGIWSNFFADKVFFSKPT